MPIVGENIDTQTHAVYSVILLSHIVFISNMPVYPDMPAILELKYPIYTTSEYKIIS